MAKKPRYTAAQLANDPSLRWCPYRRWESLWSDVHQADMRFVRYEGDGMVRLATLDAIAELPELVREDQVRRYTAHGVTCWEFQKND